MGDKETQLAAEVAELLKQAQEVDEEEDRRYGQDQRGDELPEELAFREGRLEKIRAAMAALDAEAEAQAEQAEGKGHPGVPDAKAQRNFTDPESCIMPGPGGRDFLQAYNCQTVVDHAHQVIVAARATNLTSDKQQAVTMIEKTIDNTGAVPREVSADSGYYSARAVEDLQALGVDPFIVPEQTRHGRVPPPAPRGPDASQITDQAGSAALRVAHGNGGTGLWPDQAGPRLPAVPVAWVGEGEGRVVADLHRPQPAETVPVQWPNGWQPSLTSHLDNRESALITASPPGEVINPTAQISSDPASNPRTGC